MAQTTGCTTPAAEEELNPEIASMLIYSGEGSAKGAPMAAANKIAGKVLERKLLVETQKR